MLKHALSFILLFLSQHSQGAAADICQAGYPYDGTTYELHISYDAENLKLLVDRPTPYGIRNFSYAVTHIDCAEDGAQISARAQNGELLDLSISTINGSSSYRGTIFLNKKYRYFMTWTCIPEVLHVLCDQHVIR